MTAKSKNSFYRFAYKKAKSGKLHTREFLANSEREALRMAPKEITLISPAGRKSTAFLYATLGNAD